MQDFWPSCGFGLLQHDAHDGLVPGADWFRLALARPELALVEEACAAEIALHHALLDDPLRVVSATELGAISDDDARQNYTLFLRFRDALRAAGTLEAWYLGLMRGARIDIPPLFVDWVVQAIVRRLLDDSNDAIQARAGEMLFRAQRISTQGGQLLAADQAVVEMLHDSGGFGEIGRLLTQMGAPLRSSVLQVLGADNEADYWLADTRHDFLLDLSHQTTQQLGHGLAFQLTRSRSGLKGLAQLLQKWVAHLLGVQVRITPQPRIDDAQWRWHIGLDVESTALLNALYQGDTVEPERLARLISLFRLDFDNPAEMRGDIAGRPVYLGLAMTAQGGLKLKPQNLLLNLPLAKAS